MANNIKTEIKEFSKDKRQSEKTRKQAKELERFIGTNKPIPKKLKQDIFDNESKGDASSIMKKYVKNK